MTGPNPHLRAYVWLLAILLLLCGFAYALYSFGIGAPAQQSQTTLPSYPSDLPPLKPQDSTGQQQPFQYLVSYTVSGFHPTALSINAGQTIRFTSNDPTAITIQTAGAQSPTLSQNMYWQYTPTKAGTLTFTAGNSTITVTVTK